MGTFLTVSDPFVDGDYVNATNLNALVEDAILEDTAISALTAKTPIATTDEFIINDGGTLKKVTGNDVIPSGSIVQVVNSVYPTSAAITTAIPIDDTIPQIGEGTEIVTATITLKYATSKIEISFAGQCSALVAATAVVALFKDSDVNAIQAACVSIAAANALSNAILPPTLQTPGTVGPFTYRVRTGLGVAGTLRFNGTSAARIFGGVSTASLTLKEIRV